MSGPPSSRPLRILVTGSAGFVASYLVPELLARGHSVVGIDDLSKCGPVARSFDGHPRFSFVRGDAKDVKLLQAALRGCHHMVTLAARVGGIAYLHQLSYDLCVENMRLSASAFDAALAVFDQGDLERLTFISSSHVYGETPAAGAREGDELKRCPPTAYGVQKLSAEFLARDARAQHDLPFSILRPFNCVGVGEQSAQALRGRGGPLAEGLGLHVLPDLVARVAAGEEPLRILGSGRQQRNYIHGSDLARGIRMALESDAATNEDFNLTSGRPTTVLELATLVWQRMRAGRPFQHESRPGAASDLQNNVGTGDKARTLLGFTCLTSLERMVDEVVDSMAAQSLLTSGAKQSSPAHVQRNLNRRV